MAIESTGSRVALVTGASSGLGKAFAKALLADGHPVYAAARRVDLMADLAAAGAVTLPMDITREDDINAVVDRITREHGGVEILVNNAGFGLYGAMEDIPLDAARYQFEVNLFGMARLTQRLLPAMRARRRGRIINLSSMGGRIYLPLGSWYHATKHAIEGWSDCLRLELAEWGIDVVILEPGVIATEFSDVMVEPLLERSGTGAYARLANGLAKAVRASAAAGGASSPDVIVDLLRHAIRAARPRTRYAAGKYARPMMFLRKWLGDRAFDQVAMAMVK